MVSRIQELVQSNEIENAFKTHLKKISFKIHLNVLFSQLMTSDIFLVTQRCSRFTNVTLSLRNDCADMKTPIVSVKSMYHELNHE